MPPRPSAVLVPARSAVRSLLPEALRVLVLFSGGTVGGLLLAATGRVLL